MSISKRILLSVAFLLCATAAYAATHYVSPTGTAEWAASTDIAQPSAWSTAMANAVAGDIVYFRGGTYDPGTDHVPDYEYPSMNPTNSGTACNTITFIAYPGETPTITGNNSGTAFGAGHRDYIVWDGFTATGASSASVLFTAHVWYSTGSIIRNSTFTGVANNGSNNFGSVRFEKSTDCQFYGNSIYGDSGTGVNTTGMWVFASTRLLVYNNTIYNSAHGIMQKTGPNVQNKYYKNFIYNISSQGIYLNEQFSTGTGGEVYQNVLDNTNGIHLEGVSASAKINDYQVYNNTIYGTAAGITTTSYVDNATVWNNIISGSNAPFLRYYSGDSLPSYSDNNNFYHASSFTWNLDYSTDYTSIANWRTATSLDTYSITTDPGFVAAGTHTAESYKRSSYPTDGRGGDYYSVMGAYITGSETIGASSDDSSPNPFSFGTDVTGAELSTLTEDATTITIAGIDAGQTPAITVSGTGCQYEIDGSDSWTANAGTVGLDNVVALRTTSSGTHNATITCTVTIGGVSDSWGVTTLTFAADATPPRFRGGGRGGWR